MRKFAFIAISMFVPTFVLAQTGSTGLESAGDGIASYLPYVQSVCYALAGVVAIVGAIGVNMAYQTAPQEVRKRTLMTVGGALCFVCMAIAMPQFFGLDGSDGTGGFSDDPLGHEKVLGRGGILASETGGLPSSGIKTDIPNLADKSWVTFPDGSNMSTADYVMDIYTENDSNFDKTVGYLQNLLRTGQITNSDYLNLIGYAESLPH